MIKAKKNKKSKTEPKSVNVKMDGTGETLIDEYAAVTQAFVNLLVSSCVSKGEMDVAEKMKKDMHENLNVAFRQAKRQMGEAWSNS